MHKNNRILVHTMNKVTKSGCKIIENVDTFYASP